MRISLASLTLLLTFSISSSALADTCTSLSDGTWGPINGGTVAWDCASPGPSDDFVIVDPTRRRAIVGLCRAVLGRHLPELLIGLGHRSMDVRQEASWNLDHSEHAHPPTIGRESRSQLGGSLCVQRSVSGN